MHWTKGNCAPDDVEYSLSITDLSSKETVNNLTQQTQMTLHLNQGIKYKIFIKAQLCNGNVTSETSNEIVLHITGRLIALGAIT